MASRVDLYTKEEIQLFRDYMSVAVPEEELEICSDELIIETIEIIARGGGGDLERPKETDQTIELNPDDLEVVTGAGKLEDLLDQIKRAGIYKEMKRLLNTEGGKVAAVQLCVGLGTDLVYLCNDVIGLIK